MSSKSSEAKLHGVNGEAPWSRHVRALVAMKPSRRNLKMKRANE
jgi:hypothetical protein